MAEFLTHYGGAYLAAIRKPPDMGSIVEFNCRSCGFTSENLRVGWGKGAHPVLGDSPVSTCKRLSVVDLAAKLDTHRCQECQGQLQLLEGMAQDIPCPECTKVLRSTNLGVWN
jgi:predicted RNA-binding Zn-ribbon protein involved in translation (DUF1610 family)